MGLMASRIEVYALIGDCDPTTLVGRDGSIDWLGFLDSTRPRALPRSQERPTMGAGCWRAKPRLIDFMPPRMRTPELVRIIEGGYDEARDIFERLLSLRNDVGLLSEQYDPAARRMVGNFPQAFSHLALLQAAARIIIAERIDESLGALRGDTPSSSRT
jgi:hypothetical protein